MRRLRSVLPSERPSRRLGAALALVGALAVAIGIVFGAGLPGSSNGASQPAKGSGSTTVQERNLVATDTESGTLSYANPQTVFNRLSGTITALPAVGQVVKPGQTLYKVDGAPVILLDGTTPAYRDLSASVTDGTDVQELKQNLVTLGFDPSHQITINTTFDAATTAAVERWQASLNETQTGTVTLGQIVFLPGIQRVTAVDTVLGSTGGASGSGSGAGSSASSGTATGASTSPATPRAEFVSLTTKPMESASSTAAAVKPASSVAAAVKSASPTSAAVSSAANNTASRTCPAPASTPASSTTPAQTTTTPTTTTPTPSCNHKSGAGSPSTLAALIALLKAETLELKKSKASSSTSPASAGGGRSTGGSSSSASSAGRSGGTGGGATSSATGTAGSAAGTSGTTGAPTAQAILQTTSNQLVVTVALDATKQSEAVVGQPVTVQLPNGSTVNGKITQVSPVAQSASSSSSSSSGTGGAASSTPSATVPVTITLSGHRPDAGLDQAAVSVNFEQQSAHNVLSVPVTALLATAGGGYAVQEAAPPHQLIPVTTGLFAAGYVQISGPQVAAGLQVTDSQG